MMRVLFVCLLVMIKCNSIISFSRISLGYRGVHSLSLSNSNSNDNNYGNEFNQVISSQLALASNVLNCSRISLYFTNSDSNSYDNDQLSLIYTYPNDIDKYDYNYDTNRRIDSNTLTIPLYLESKVIGVLDIENFISNSNNNIVDIIVTSISNAISMEAKRLSLFTTLSSIKDQYNDIQYRHSNCYLTVNTLGKMLKKRLNSEDNIGIEILDNIFVQVNSMSEMVAQLEYVTNANSNKNSADYYKDNINDNDSILISTEIISTDMNNEIWIPVKEEIDFNIEDNDGTIENDED